MVELQCTGVTFMNVIKVQNSPFNRVEAMSGLILTKIWCHTLYS